MIKVNCFPMSILSHYYIPIFQERKHKFRKKSAIINVSSMAGKLFFNLSLNPNAIAQCLLSFKGLRWLSFKGFKLWIQGIGYRFAKTIIGIDSYDVEQTNRYLNHYCGSMCWRFYESFGIWNSYQWILDSSITRMALFYFALISF